MVLRLWQEWHKLSRLFSSINRAQSPLWSWMWSTSVAITRNPLLAHSLQNGSRRSWAGRRFFVQIGKLYQLCQVLLSRRGAGFGLWEGHHPSRVKAPQPGYRQGLSGLFAMGYHLQEKQKRQSPQQPFGRYGLWRFTLWPLSIFRTISFLQVRQYTGKSFAIVSGPTRIRRWLRLQIGHVTHPSLTVSLPYCGTFCNIVNPFYCKMEENILTPKTEKNRKAILFFGVCVLLFSCCALNHKGADT